MTTMRAMVLTDINEPLEERVVPRPTPGPGEVLVRVQASGVNPLDTKIAAGAAPHARVVAPAILGLDVAGQVAAVGSEVADFGVGDEVYGMVGGVGELAGTVAEFVVADASLLALKPTALAMGEAAALPLVGITAWEGLVDRADVQPGYNVLVIGGAEWVWPRYRSLPPAAHRFSQRYARPGARRLRDGVPQR